MSYKIKFLPEAQKDLKEFNPAQQRQIGIQIKKFSQNPLPKNEGGYGNPLGNKRGRNLTGLCKIVLKKLGVRVVYELIREDDIMEIIVISVRADEEVYKIADKRTNNRG